MAHVEPSFCLSPLVGTDLKFEVQKDPGCPCTIGMMVAIGEIQKHLGPTPVLQRLTLDERIIRFIYRNTMRKVLYLVSMMVRTEIKLLIWMKMVIWTKSLLVKGIGRASGNTVREVETRTQLKEGRSHYLKTTRLLKA